MASDAEDAELKQMLNLLNAKLLVADREAKEAVSRRDALRQSVSGLRAVLYPPKPLFDPIAGVAPETQGDPEAEPVPAKRPKGKAAAYIVLKENAEVGFTAMDLYQKLKERGWEPDTDNPEPVLRVTLTRLLADHPDQIARLKPGVYAFAPNRARAAQQQGGGR